jgi:hypothetical protein
MKIEISILYPSHFRPINLHQIQNNMLNWDSKINFHASFVQNYKFNKDHLFGDFYAKKIVSFVKDSKSQEIFKVPLSIIAGIILESLDNIISLKDTLKPCNLKFHKSGIIKLNDHSNCGYFAQCVNLLGLYDDNIDKIAKESNRNHFNLILFSELLVHYLVSNVFNFELLNEFKSKIDLALISSEIYLFAYFKDLEDFKSVTYVKNFNSVLRKISKSIAEDEDYKSEMQNMKIIHKLSFKKNRGSEMYFQIDYLNE